MQASKPRILMSTVWHTGTTYFRIPLLEQYGQLEARHCCPEVLPIVHEYDWIVTTYRDPKRVAASWCNRGRDLNKAAWVKRWRVQWDSYWQLRELEDTVERFTVFKSSDGRVQHGHVFGPVPLNSHGDTHNLHEALNRGDLDYFYSKVPEACVRYALHNAFETEKPQ